MVGIKNMDKPKGCKDCPFLKDKCINDKVVCLITKTECYSYDVGMWGEQQQITMDDCPLIEIN